MLSTVTTGLRIYTTLLKPIIAMILDNQMLLIYDWKRKTSNTFNLLKLRTLQI